MPRYNKIVLSLLLGAFSQIVLSQTQQWVARYNSGASNNDNSRMLYVDPSGNSYFGFDANSGCAIAKYNSSGVQQWVTTFSDGPINWYNSLTVDASGNVYATGYKTNGPDMVTAKYNSSGVQQWMSVYSCASYTWCSFSEGTAITIDGSYVYVTGKTSGVNVFPPYYHFITIKYALSTGATQAGWPVEYDAPNNDDIPTSIVVDGSGNVYVTGYTGAASSGSAANDWATIAYNPSGSVIAGWPKIYNGPGSNADAPVQLLVSGANIVVTGFSQGSGTLWDITTIMYDGSGNVVAGWPQRYNGPGNSYDGIGNTGNYSSYMPMVIDASGNIFLCGWSVGSGTGYDMVTIKYNASGTQQWATRYNSSGAQDDIGRGIALHSITGSILVAGSKNTGGNSDYALLKYNSSGTQQWVATYDGPSGGFDEAAAVSVVGTDIWITGTSAGSGTGPDMCTIKYTDATLPIELLSFSGKILSDNSVLLNWLTASEQGNHYFTIERSVDGNEFTAAGTTAGAGNSHTTLSYEFVDELGETPYSVLPALYYRLKQTDYDGTFAYSQAVSVQQNDEEIFSVLVDQNDNTAGFTFILNRSEKVLLEVYDISGKRIARKEVVADKGFNKISVPLTTISDGAYLAAFIIPGKRTSKKFIIDR